MTHQRRRLALLAAAAALYALCRRAYYVGFFNDDALAILGARSLLSGRYFADALPGFSLILAPLAAVSGQALWPYRAAAILLTLAALWFFADVAETLCPDTPLAAVALAAFSPLTLSMSATVLSDVPMLAGAMAALAWAKHLWQEKQLVRWLPLTILVGFCALLRPTGIALALAFTLALAFERRWREAALFYLMGCFFLVPYLFRRRLLTGEGSFLSLNISNLSGNLGYYLKLIFATMLFRFPKDPAVLVAVAVGVGAVAAGYGLRDAGWKGWRKLPALFLALFLGAHLLWGRQAGRYALPMLPIIYAYFLRGMAVLGGRAAKDRRKLAWGAATLSLALLAVPDFRVAQSALAGTAGPRPPQRVAAWIRANTADSSIFAVELDARFSLLTNRRAVRLPKLFAPDDFHNWLLAQSVSFVAAFPSEPALAAARSDAPVDPLPAGSLLTLLADTSRYELVCIDPIERAAVYRVKPVVASAAD